LDFDEISEFNPFLVPLLFQAKADDPSTMVLRAQSQEKSGSFVFSRESLSHHVPLHW
jgi:hypothetical protein